MSSIFSRMLILLCLALAVLCSPFATLAQQNRKPKNPLGDFFRQLDRNIREGAEEIERAKTGKDQLDIRPVQRPEDNRRLQQVRELIEEGRWSDAAEVLQFLLDQPTDVFSVNELREFRSLQSEVDRILGELPPEGMRNYVNRYGVRAEQLLKQAFEEQDDALLLKVSTHYFHTPAGRTSLQILAQNWQDHGEFSRSAEAWSRLLATAENGDQAKIRRSLVWNLIHAGRKNEAIPLLEPLPADDPLRDQLEQFTLPKVSPAGRGGPYFPFAGTTFSAQTLDPTLLPRWSSNLIERYAVESQLETLQAELREQGRALLPTIQPLAVDGKLAFRTLRSLQVRDLSTGQLLWERRMQQSPEELLTQSDRSDELQFDHSRFSRGGLFEQHPLASLVYRDQVYGTLTSDGTRLFSVESSGPATMTAPIQMWQRSIEGSNASVPWETNELTAYDLGTGQIRWQVGGEVIEPQFSRPLAGTHFFSAPTPDGAELYIIGERDGEVSLYCLSTQTGEELWSQPLAEPGRPLASDMIRRYWAAQPVLADGAIICPTTCGWLIAIDRTTQRLKWTSRYAPRLEQHRHFRGGYSVQSLQELNRRWQDVITLESNGRILVTPPELPDEFGMTQPMLYCIDLQTGKTLWEQSKADRTSGMGLYLAGIWNDQALIVGVKSVIARQLENGEVAWRISLTDPPSGRGIIVNDKMLLPIAGTKLQLIDLPTATIEKTLLPAVETSLGNLNLHQDQLISLSYENATVFPANGLSVTPESDPALLAKTQLRQAKLLLANQQFSQLTTLLQKALSSKSLSSELKQAFTDAQRNGLIQKLRTQPDDASLILEQLQQLAQTPQQLRDYQQLLANHLIEIDDYSPALKTCLEILEHFPRDERIVDETRIVRVDSWVGGRLRTLYQSHTLPAERYLFDEQVQEKLNQLPEDAVIRDRWARALAFHPLGLKLEMQLAEEALQAGRSAEALLRLQRVTQADNTLLRAESLARLGTVLTDLGWHRDAMDIWEQLQQETATTLPGGENSKERATLGIKASREALAQETSQDSLWEAPWKLERVGVSGNEKQLTAIPTVGIGLKELDQLRFQQEPDSARVRIENRQTGNFLASFPLRSLPALEHNPNVGSRLSGPIVFIMHRGVLHALAWPDQQMLWTWSPELRSQAITRLALVQVNSNFNLQPVSHFPATRLLQASRTQTGYLLAANPRALLLQCKDWIALDPLTGEELWRDQQAGERSQAYDLGSDWFDTISRGHEEVRSAIDGQIRPDGETADTPGKTLAVEKLDQIVLNRKTGNKNTAEVARISATGDVLWNIELPVNSRLGMPDDRSLILLTSEQELLLINLQSGQKLNLGKLTLPSTQGNPSVSVLFDDQGYYVFVDKGDTQHTYVNLPAIRFSGRILAFDHQGQTRWIYDTPKFVPLKIPESQQDPAPSPEAKSDSKQRSWPLNVLVQDFEISPLVLLVGDRVDHQDDLYFHQLRVIGIDKKTGQPLIDWERPSESGGFCFLHVDPEQRAIELRTYNERLHIRPQFQLPASEEAVP